MSGFFDLAAGNLLTPMVLFFALGAAAALVRSDLSVPEAVAKALALYLVLAIGFKGGAEMAAHGLDAKVAAALVAGVLLSFGLPLVAFGLLRAATGLARRDAAAVAAHYGSISIVTFVAATEALKGLGIVAEGYMVAVAAAMEAPAIFSGLWLAAGGSGNGNDGGSGRARIDSVLLREIAANGSIVLLVGAFVIGWITGGEGLATVAPFLVDPFKGVLCLFLLDMGLVAGCGLRQSGRALGPATLLFGLYMPLVGAAFGGLAAWLVGLGVGGSALLITLSASASYIAVPAALRLALPEVKPAVPLTLSLGVTFPFNLTLGIPLYVALAELLA